MYPLRRNYTSSLTTIDTRSDANPGHNCIDQECIETRNGNAKLVAMAEFQLGQGVREEFLPKVHALLNVFS